MDCIWRTLTVRYNREVNPLSENIPCEYKSLHAPFTNERQGDPKKCSAVLDENSSCFSYFEELCEAFSIYQWVLVFISTYHVHGLTHTW